jgi:crotonobetainyl-CoA:carnitine CoA-transferase CaiB-like acyl-CoA transferase
MEGVDATRHTAARELGADNESVLASAGYSPQQIAALNQPASD